MELFYETLGTIALIILIIKLTKWVNKHKPHRYHYQDIDYLKGDIGYESLCREYAVKNMELYAAMRRTSLDGLLKTNRLSYQEHAALCNELKEWQAKQMEEIYKK